jgi:2-oxoglutarate ferredoxin oxidoreductase subunit alpha
VFVLSDLDFGMNQWMTEPFKYPDVPIDRGKLLWEGDLERLNGDWGRYRDVDGDGIPYRTVPGNRHPRAAFFTRGTGHNTEARYSEDDQVWLALMDRLKKKYETARQFVPEPVIETQEDAGIGIVAFGSTEPAIQEARHLLSKEGVKTSFMRVRALPFTEEVGDFIRQHERVFVVEMNRDGQLHQLLTLEVKDFAAKLVSVAHLDGLPLTAHFVVESMQAEQEVE